jgi:tRNA threonylcarbamoyl adenosine modification protein (Sua5/YciO/YrdC/YwlC family)
MTTVAEAVDALRSGRLIGFPTDTVYGIGADPHNEAAMAALAAVKGRAEPKPIALLVASVDEAAVFAEFTPEACGLAAQHWPGPLTLVLRKADGAPSWIGDAARGTIGVRQPAHEDLLDLLRVAGPLAATSANPAGQPSARTAEEAKKAFGGHIACYLPGSTPGGAASTVLDVTSDRVVMLRTGPVLWPAP